MPTILTRVPVYSEWNPGELAGPYAALTLREWEVAVVTCTLADAQQQLLREELLEPATPACMGRECWPLTRRFLPFEESILRQSTPDTLRKQVLEGLVAIWQLLDLPPEVIPGMLRGLLLVGLGARLRQTLAAFEGQAEALSAQRELEQALSKLDIQAEPAPARPVSLQKQRRKRWWRRGAA